MSIDTYKVGTSVTRGRTVISVVFWTKEQALTAYKLLSTSPTKQIEIGEKISRFVAAWRTSGKDPSANIKVSCFDSGSEFIATSCVPLSIRQLATIAAATTCQNEPGVANLYKILGDISAGIAENNKIYHPFLLAEHFQKKAVINTK